MVLPDNVGRYAIILTRGLYSIQLTSALRKHLDIGQFSLFSFNAFPWSPSIGKPRMTPVSFVKTTESYVFRWSPSVGKPRMTPVSSVRTTESYKFCRWIIQGLPIRSRSESCINRNEPKRVGLIISPDQTVHAVHSCKCWFRIRIKTKKVPSRADNKHIQKKEQLPYFKILAT